MMINSIGKGVRERERQRVTCGTRSARLFDGLMRRGNRYNFVDVLVR